MALSASDRLWTGWLKSFLAGALGDLGDHSLAGWGKEIETCFYLHSSMFLCC
jgi:hypothetical protein